MVTVTPALQQGPRMSRVWASPSLDVAMMERLRQSTLRRWGSDGAASRPGDQQGDVGQALFTAVGLLTGFSQPRFLTLPGFSHVWRSRLAVQVSQCRPPGNHLCCESLGPAITMVVQVTEFACPSLPLPPLHREEQHAEAFSQRPWVE